MTDPLSHRRLCRSTALRVMLRDQMRDICAVERGIMEKDVVYGVQVDPTKAAATSQYNGRTYYSAQRAARPSSTPIPLSTKQ